MPVMVVGNMKEVNNISNQHQILCQFSELQFDLMLQKYFT